MINRLYVLGVTSEAAKLIDLRDDLFCATICQDILQQAKKVASKRVQMSQSAVDEHDQMFSDSNQIIRPSRLPTDLVAKIISFVPDYGRTKCWPESSSKTIIYVWLPHVYLLARHCPWKSMYISTIRMLPINLLDSCMKLSKLRALISTYSSRQTECEGMCLISNFIIRTAGRNSTNLSCRMEKRSFGTRVDFHADRKGRAGISLLIITGWL